MQTNIPTVYAIGDIVPTPQLAHTASAEAMLAVDHLAGKGPEALNYQLNPNCTYSEPEVASVGYTERAAKEAGYEIKVGKFPFSALGKARIMNQTDGFVKVISDTKYDEVLGVHIIGPRATDLIAEAAVALKLETTTEELAHTIHAHPTLPEACSRLRMQPSINQSTCNESKCWYARISTIGQALAKPSCVAIGNFDGVHHGHRVILDERSRWPRA